jgi:hypothetical protein
MPLLQKPHPVARNAVAHMIAVPVSAAPPQQQQQIRARTLRAPARWQPVDRRAHAPRAVAPERMHACMGGVHAQGRPGFSWG